MEAVQIIEIDVERDRKACVTLDLKVSGANRELAEWLLNHPQYSLDVVSGWLGCGRTRIHDLRVWAKAGFSDDSHPTRSRRKRKDVRRAEHSGLESLDNFESDDKGSDSDHVASPAEVEDNLLHIIQRQGAGAMAVKKILKVSSLDREAKARISEAIDRLIAKWRSTQATLAPRKDSKC